MNEYTGAKLTLGSHCQYHKTILEKTTSVATEAFHLKTLYDAYKAAINKEESVVNRQRGYVETAGLAEADHRRDLNLSILSNVIKAQLMATVEADYEAAERLDSLMRPYYNIQAHEINRQTTEVDGLINQLKGEDVHALLQTLGLGNTYTALNEANASVKTYLADRVAEAEKRADVAAISTVEQRREVDTLYKQLVATVNANAIIAPDAALDTYINTANAVSAEYKLVAANQAKSRKKEEEPK